MQAPDVKVFISYTEAQESVALYVAAHLRKFSDGRIETWNFEENLFLGHLWENVEKQIRESDYFLLILSDDAIGKDGVRRELGIALHYRDKREGNPYPQIVGVRATRGAPTSIIPLKWTGDCDISFEAQSSLTPYDCGRERFYEIEEIEALAKRLLPETTIITDYGSELFEASIPCYDALFPYNEQDGPEDIKRWAAEEEELGEDSSSRDLYLVHHVDNHVIGVAYFSTYVDQPWWFGNYFGILQQFKTNRAKRFFNDIDRKLNGVNPRSRGIVFEIDYIDHGRLRFLRDVLVKGDKHTLVQSEAFAEGLRRLERLFIFSQWGAQMVLGANGKPLPYWQPAMRRPLDPKEKVRLFLMFKRHGSMERVDFSTYDVLEFVYNRVYADAYGGTDTASITGFRKHLAGIRRYVRSRMARSGEQLGTYNDIDYPFKTPRNIKELFTQLEKLAKDNKLPPRL